MNRNFQEIVHFLIFLHKNVLAYGVQRNFHNFALFFYVLLNFIAANSTRTWDFLIIIRNALDALFLGYLMWPSWQFSTVIIGNHCPFLKYSQFGWRMSNFIFAKSSELNFLPVRKSIKKSNILNIVKPSLLVGYRLYWKLFKLRQKIKIRKMKLWKNEIKNLNVVWQKIKYSETYHTQY